MGFFSNDCAGCGHPMLSVYSASPINTWMTQCLTITPQGVVIGPGTYDGYGRIEDELTGEMLEAQNAYSDVTCWHEACWQLSGDSRIFGPSGYRGPSPASPDQGYFFGTEHDVENPWIKIELAENARIARAEGEMGR